MGTRSFVQLEVWQVAHQEVLETYRVTRTFPPDERSGLVRQMRRAAVSIPANIVEGYGRFHLREKARFYNISQASLEELRYYFILAKDLGFMGDFREHHGRLDSVARMLKTMVQKMSLPGFSYS